MGKDKIFLEMSEDNIDEELKKFVSGSNTGKKRSVIVRLKNSPTPKFKIVPSKDGNLKHIVASQDEQGATGDDPMNEFSQVLDNIQVFKYKRLDTAHSFVAELNPEQLKSVIKCDLVQSIALNQPHSTITHS